MEFPISAAGKRIYPTEFKKKVLEEIKSGSNVQEIACKYGIPMQNIFNWKRSQDRAVL